MYINARFFIASLVMCCLARAVTTQKLPVYQLPFYEDEYPFEITLTLNNTTHEPIFFLTRYFDGTIHEEVMLEPFETTTYTVSVPSWSEIHKTWILFSFNEGNLREFAEKINTGRNIQHIVKTQKSALGIVTIERQKKFKPTIRTITISNINLQANGAWKLT